MHYGLCTLVFYSINLFSQEINLKEFEWNNRIVLVISEDENGILYKQQLQEFGNDHSSFSERKLLLFDIKKNKHRKIDFAKTFTKMSTWEDSKVMYQRFSDKQATLKIVLIGLDGGIKSVYRNEILKKEVLFEVIDGMFLRKQELKRKP